MQTWAGNGCGLGQGRLKVSGGCAGFKWKVWGLAQGCRQINEWGEFGRERVARQGGSVLISWQLHLYSIFFHLFFILCDFFCCILLHILLFTNGVMTELRLRVVDGWIYCWLYGRRMGDGERCYGRNFDVLFATRVFNCIHNINTWGILMPIYWCKLLFAVCAQLCTLGLQVLLVVMSYPSCSPITWIKYVECRLQLLFV